MIPASLRAVIEKREPVMVTFIHRDGCVQRQNRDGSWKHFTTVDPIPEPKPQPITEEDDDNPFPP
jgi:hypothetical protein